MSEENVEIVRRLYETMNATGLEATIPFLDPDFEFVPPADWPDSLTLQGIEPIQEMARQWVETFDDFKIDPERFVNIGGDRVLVYAPDRGRIKDSDVEIDNAFHPSVELGWGHSR